MTAMSTDVLVVGGGLGGVAAAHAALTAGRRVILTEEYAWLGGQLTSQAVPPDEHSWVEHFGVTATYRRLREGIREYYRRAYPLSAKARLTRDLNPGAGLVSRLCSEPAVAVAVIDEMLMPFVGGGRLTILKPAQPTSASVEGDRVTSVTVLMLATGESHEITADFVLDATELGDVLPMTGTEYVTGFESRNVTGEPSAPAHAQPDNQQAISWCLAFDHVDGNHVIDKPSDYDYWRAYQPDFWGAPLLSLTAPHPRTLETVTRSFNPLIDDDPYDLTADQRVNPGDRELWTFRRIAAAKLFTPGAYDSDVVIMNWPMIDYFDGPIVDNQNAPSHLEASRQLSLSVFYWLQTEVPRPDGGTGWAGLRLRGDITGTVDGLAQAPYIRESRRIRALFTVVEQDLSVEARGHGRPATYFDSVGVGMYRIDLHPSTGGDNYIDVPSAPFEIPLGALIPIRMANVLPAGKNVGTTHITNGAFRLHPVEWNIGEAAGWLAAFCLNHAVEPREVRTSSKLLEEYQSLLIKAGVELHWPDISGY